jgi:hypothetical protein
MGQSAEGLQRSLANGDRLRLIAQRGKQVLDVGSEVLFVDGCAADLVGPRRGGA